jgi:hypothetical protein
MSLHRTTPVPNVLLDILMYDLTPGELKVLLVVVRQTYGFVQHPYTSKRKTHAWIAVEVFKRKGGLSHSTISIAIKGLIEKKLIRVTDSKGRLLNDSKKRAKAHKLIFYPMIQICKSVDNHLITRG